MPARKSEVPCSYIHAGPPHHSPYSSVSLEGGVGEGPCCDCRGVLDGGNSTWTTSLLKSIASQGFCELEAAC